MLKGKKILLGISGGIAAYKAPELCRLLIQAGADVRVIMTESATKFVQPLTLATLSNAPVETDTFAGQGTEHIALADWADLAVIAPATANLIGKLANGIADDMLTTTLLACQAPRLLVPAMNTHMWENPAVQRNCRQVQLDGYHLMEPDAGFLACGYTGKGRMPDPSVIVAEFEKFINRNQSLKGKTVLITAGATREPIDPVRYLSNPSTGKMGFALAAEARHRGAHVTLVAGPTHLETPAGVERIDVTTALEMYDAVSDRFTHCSIFIACAAVSDFRAAAIAPQKVKKSDAELTISFVPNPDILAEMGDRRQAGQILVGFAAETHDVAAYGRQKRITKKADLIVANDVSQADRGFGSDTNQVLLITAQGEAILPLQSKQAIASGIWDAIERIHRASH